MATRRQREAAAPRPAVNAGPRNQTAAGAARSGPSRNQMAAAAARSGPRNQMAAAAARSGPRNQMAAAAARSGPRNQMAAATARSGPRNQTAAATAAAAPSGPRNQTVVATVTGRPHARNRRALGDIGNHVNAPVVDREASRRCLTRGLSARPNAAAADENTIAPRSCSSCSSGGAGASRAVSGENKKLSKGATTRVTRTRAKTDATASPLMERVAAAEAKAARAVEEMERTASLFQVLNDRYDKLAGAYHRHKQFITEATQILDKLHAMVDKKESELQKVLDLNVRLLRVVDQKEAQLQALSEQCKTLALNSN